MQAKEVHLFVFWKRWSEWTLAVEPQLWIRRVLRWSSALTHRGENTKEYDANGLKLCNAAALF